MKKLLIAAVTMFALAGAYVALPLWTAWSIRNAIRGGNAAYLERAIEWPSVKETLKPSLIEIALGPQSNAGAGDASFWARMTSFASQKGADALVEAYVTPEGLPQLFQYGKLYRERIKGQIDDTDSLPIGERAWRLWKRLKRAEFKSATRFEFLLADKFTAERHYDGALELRGWGWKMTELRIRMIKEEAAK